jgi:predicted GNAT superfamily acetyltransferase
MLAVKDEYRNRRLGYSLKLAQRERALMRGISTMTWTFDPLQSRNAHLNFSRLGVISRRYEIDYYGPETSSFLHRNIGTDRLWVHWPLRSERVSRLIEERGGANHPPVEVEPLVRLESDGSPRLRELNESPVESRALIEIPHDIGLLQEQNPGLATEWRRATRRAFSWALSAGYFVDEFYSSKEGDSRCGIYLLSKWTEGFA